MHAILLTICDLQSCPTSSLGEANVIPMCPFCIVWDVINLPLSKQTFHARVSVRDGAFDCKQIVWDNCKGPIM